MLLMIASTKRGWDKKIWGTKSKEIIRDTVKEITDLLIANIVFAMNKVV